MMSFFNDFFPSMVISGSVSLLLTVLILVIVDFFKGDSATSSDPKYEFLAEQVTHLNREIEAAAQRFQDYENEQKANEQRLTKLVSQMETMAVLHVETQVNNLKHSLKQELITNTTHIIKRELNSLESRMGDRTLKMIRGAQHALLAAMVEEAAIMVRENRAKLENLKQHAAQAAEEFKRHSLETTVLQSRLTNGGVGWTSVDACAQYQGELVKNSDALLHKMDAEKSVIETEMGLNQTDALAIHLGRVASKRFS